jgi:hypothetical protein
MSRRLILLLAATVVGAGGCQSKDFVAPPARATVPTGSVSHDCTPIDPAMGGDCTADSANGDGSGVTYDTSVSGFWPDGFAIDFQHDGSSFIGEAGLVTPIGFSGTQTYNFAGTDFWGTTCYGEIFLNVGEATSLNAFQITVISNFVVLDCY